MDFSQQGRPAVASVIPTAASSNSTSIANNATVALSYHRQGKRLFVASSTGGSGSHLQVVDCLLTGKTDRPALRVDSTRIRALQATHHEDCVLWAGEEADGLSTHNPPVPSADRHAITYHSIHDNKVLRKFRGHMGAICGLSQCPANDTFLSASSGGAVRLWTLQSAACLAECKLPSSSSSSNSPPLAVFDNSGLVFGIATAAATPNPGNNSYDHHVHLYDARNYNAGAFAEWTLTADAVRTAAGEAAAATWQSMAFNGAGNQMLIAGDHGLCLLLDGFEGTIQGALVHPSSSSNQSITACFASDDKHVLTAVRDESNQNASASSNATTTTTSSGNAVVHVWDAATRQPAATRLSARHTAPVVGLAANPAYAQLVSASARETALWSW